MPQSFVPFDIFQEASFDTLFRKQVARIVIYELKHNFIGKFGRGQFALLCNQIIILPQKFLAPKKDFFQSRILLLKF